MKSKSASFTLRLTLVASIVKLAEAGSSEVSANWRRMPSLAKHHSDLLVLPAVVVLVTEKHTAASPAVARSERSTFDPVRLAAVALGSKISSGAEALTWEGS